VPENTAYLCSWCIIGTAKQDMAASSYQFGQFELDLRSYELKRDGQSLRLEKIPFGRLLEQLDAFPDAMRRSLV
jgi:DNA-binding response OmpR family regulator